MKRKIAVLMMASVLSVNAYAYDGTAIAREVASVLKGKAVARGFTTADPRYTGLVVAAGTAVTEIAVGAVVAGTAPAWGTLLASAAIAGAVGYGINALANYLFNNNGTVTVPEQSNGTEPSQAGPDTWAYDKWKSGNALAIAAAWAADYTAANPGANLTVFVQGCTNYASGAGADCVFGYTQPPYGTTNNWHTKFIGRQANVPYTCAGLTVSGVCQPPAPLPGTTPAKTVPVGDAIEALPELQKGLAIPAQTIADIADAVWRHMASKPGYDGVPYSFSDPVTAADVEADRAANPSRATPRIGDLAAPIPTTNPLAEPATSPVNNPPLNPSTQPQVNLGNDPGIGAPSLEATPTAAMIIAPIAGLMPTLKNWVMPVHVSECPTPAFDLFGQHIVMDQQCMLFEEHKTAMFNAMVAAWMLIALFILLSA